jgi:hypothetical protein
VLPDGRRGTVTLFRDPGNAAKVRLRFALPADVKV